MSRPSPILPLIVCTSLAAVAEPELRHASVAELMPHPEDYTRMWWTDGFPARVDGAPWQRGIETGHYTFVLNTETLQVPHFGPTSAGGGYTSRVHRDEASWRSLPSADLALQLTVDGKRYRSTAGGRWSKYQGPRLIESGRFFQRGDITDLVFTADDGSILNIESRFETAAWPDRLAMTLAARPGPLPIQAGDASFGRLGGGYGLDGRNHLEFPPSDDWNLAQFTFEFWVFVPEDYQAGRTPPWLVCRNLHEQADGNFGIIIRNGRIPQARLNIGGGRANAFVTKSTARRALKTKAWNHLAISYDGDTLRLHLNGTPAGERKIGRQRVPVPGGLSLGRRHDNSGDGYRFRGVVDEIRLHDRALTTAELRFRATQPDSKRATLTPVKEWPFRASGQASLTRPSEAWKSAAMEIAFSNGKNTLRSRWELPSDQQWCNATWQQASLAFDPLAFRVTEPTCPVTVQANEIPNGAARPVAFDPSLGWHRINLDGVNPVPPPDGSSPSNDALERINLVLSNPTDREQVTPLLFEKTARGFRQRIGSPITGLSVILRDNAGNPTGLPVQLSKNWHHDPAGGVYAGQWLHAISQVRLPPASTIALELTLAYGHWGGVAAASHAQLSLIGWGSNQLWNQCALGSWGESICYDPDQVQAQCTITDVRPVMVRAMGDGRPWGWTSNVGGGDVFRLFTPSGERLPHAGMRTTYHRLGPCLTEVSYAGRLGPGLTHSTTVSLARSDDLVRAVHRLRFDVTKPTDFSRFAIFQIGADTYNSTTPRTIALGNEDGLLREWKTTAGGNQYRTNPIQCLGRTPWVSLHETAPSGNQKPGALANRGLVIRSWKARLGGQEAAPWIAERGLTRHSTDSSILDLLPPPGITHLEPGDFIEATIEQLVVPQFAKDYYGPNQALQDALRKNENSWHLIHRESIGNHRVVNLATGTVEQHHPDLRIRTAEGAAHLKLQGGLGYVPITFTGLSSHHSYELLVDGQPVDQSVHGNDFWQSDYDPATKTWSRTYNLAATGPQTQEIQFRPSR